jgi:uncharacterized protein (DUF2267 family)
MVNEEGVKKLWRDIPSNVFVRQQVGEFSMNDRGQYSTMEQQKITFSVRKYSFQSGTRFISTGERLNQTLFMTSTTNYLSMEELAVRFFGEIKNELGFTSTRKIVYLVRSVMSQLRRNFSHEQASNIINKMPSLFQLLFISNWKYNEKETSINHLDEIVDRVYQQGTQPLFSSEVETLNAVIVVLKKLDKFFKMLGLDILHYSLKQELKQVAMEDAA